MTDLKIIMRLLEEQPEPRITDRSEIVMPRIALSGPLGSAVVLRAMQGARSYSQPLVTHDGRDTRADLFQELMDALFYSAKLLMELELSGGTEQDILIAKSIYQSVFNCAKNVIAMEKDK